MAVCYLWWIFKLETPVFINNLPCDEISSQNLTSCNGRQINSSPNYCPLFLLQKLNMDTIYKDIFSMIGSLGLAKAYGI